MVIAVAYIVEHAMRSDSRVCRAACSGRQRCPGTIPLFTAMTGVALARRVACGRGGV